MTTSQTILVWGTLTAMLAVYVARDRRRDRPEWGPMRRKPWLVAFTIAICAGFTLPFTLGLRAIVMWVWR